VAYLTEQFRQIGLEPGNGDSYVQDVPLVSITVEGAPALVARAGESTHEFAFGDEWVGWTKRVVDRAALTDSELVFVGYGVVAPEYEWDDYQGLDVSGKTVVILVNDPGFATQDPELFNGNAMTYYGRWTYKFEEAARQGARGALVVHETAAAGYPWEVVQNSWTGPQFSLASADDNMGRVELEGWISGEVARRLFEAAGQDYDASAAAATEGGFAPVELGVGVSTSLSNTLVRSSSANVIGRLAGVDRPDEYVVYMAHWDHFGMDPSLEGDQIYNGAFDNATGTSGLLELARAFTSLDSGPSRSLLFLAVTAEEQGLLGSAYYAQNPVYPRQKTVAAINMDGMNVDGPMRDITVIGYGNSELDDYVEEAAAEQGRTVRSDPEPEKGFYYRSDHFTFAKEGVPALYTDAGVDHVEHGEAWTMERRAEYTAERYHKPSDEYDPSWDLTGALDDLRLLFTVGYRLASSDGFPNWRQGTEFKARRDQEMATAR
jgi:Zn-dependent M28 family amino/carboxypeptidase